jgi:hypothetical protein
VGAGVTAQAIAPGSANLAAFQKFLDETTGGARVTWMCHSYGSLVCASALNAAEPAAVVFLGSPGVQTDRADQLPTNADIYAARGDLDVIPLTRIMSIAGASFGPDPTSADFGAKKLPCGSGTGHFGYYKPGSTQVAALIDVATGRAT